MPIEENKAIVRLMCDEVFNKGNLALIDEVCAANYVEHLPGLPSGLEGFKHFLTMLRAAFPDLQVTIEDLIGEGDKVVWRWTMHGTHLGELFIIPPTPGGDSHEPKQQRTHQEGLFTIPPTGMPATWMEIQIGRFADGKLVEHWMSFNQLDMLQQLGLVGSSRQAS